MNATATVNAPPALRTAALAVDVYDLHVPAPPVFRDISHECREPHPTKAAWRSCSRPKGHTGRHATYATTYVSTVWSECDWSLEPCCDGCASDLGPCFGPGPQWVCLAHPDGHKP